MSSSDPKEPLCFTDFALQEFAFGRLEQSVREQINAHTQSCPECAARLEQLRLETAKVRELLLHGSDAAPTVATPCPARETLALYLDGALSENDAQTCLVHLAGCAACRESLVALYRDLSQVLGGQPDMDEALAESEKQGLILRMPKRSSRPAAPKRADAEGDSQDREAQL